MAFNVQKWAYRQPIKAPLKPVLVTLAYHANKLGIAWPGADTIAEETGYSRRTVLRALSQLEELDMIEALKYPKGGAGKPTEWRLCIENGDTGAPLNGDTGAPLEGTTVTEVHRKGDTQAENGDRGAHYLKEPPRTNKTGRGVQRKNPQTEDPEERVGRMENLSRHDCPDCANGWVEVSDGSVTRCKQWGAA